jgi:hypothetical protein
LADVCAKKEPGFIWAQNVDKNNHLSLSFCERYFKLGTLEGIYDMASKGSGRSDLSEYENRARAWITAMMRINSIRGTDSMAPQFVVYDGRTRFAESSSETKLLAKSNGGFIRNGYVSKPLLSGSNYAWYALAQWVQQKSGEYTQQPYVPEDIKPRQQL